MATRVKQKTLKRHAEADARPRAVARFIRISPDKVRIVLDAIRGKSLIEALAILENTPKSASEPILKVVASAAANAENNLNMSRNDLFVAECYANAGPILKRIQPTSKGRAFRINKRSSHITVILDAHN
jgi:large subunit ribosomal protein L22